MRKNNNSPIKQFDDGTNEMAPIGEEPHDEGSQLYLSAQGSSTNLKGSLNSQMSLIERTEIEETSSPIGKNKALDTDQSEDDFRIQHHEY